MSVDRRYALLRHNHGLGEPEPFNLTGVADDDFIKYNSTSEKWENFDLFGTTNNWTARQDFMDNANQVRLLDSAGTDPLDRLQLNYDGGIFAINWFDDSLGSAKDLASFDSDITSPLVVSGKTISWDDLEIGEYGTNASYAGVFHASATANTYMLLSDGTDVFVGGGNTGGAVYLRAGGSSSTNQLYLTTTAATIGGSAIALESRQNNFTGVNTFNSADTRIINTNNAVLNIIDDSSTRVKNPSIRFTTTGGGGGAGSYTSAGCLIDNVNSTGDGYFRMIRYNASAVLKVQLLLRENGKIEWTGTHSTAAESMTLNGFVMYNEGMELGYTAVTLINSWVDYSVGVYGVSSYRQAANGVVHVRIMVKNGTATASPICTLPVGARPASSQIFVGYSSAGVCRIDISDTGSIAVKTGGGTGWVALNVSFKAA